MSDNSFTPTSKARYLTPKGTVVEIVVPLTAGPDEVAAYLEQAKWIDEVALGAGLLVANQTAGNKAVQSAKIGNVSPSRKGNPMFHCVSIDVLPQADGRTKVALFGDTFKQPRDDYATVTMLWKPSELIEKFLPYHKFAIADFQVPGQYAMDCAVEWYESTKTNQAGNPYKNFSAVHAIDGGEAPAKVVAQDAPADGDVPF